jgi:HEAT repeat protein
VDNIMTNFNQEGNKAMSKSRIIFALLVALLFASTVQLFGQTVPPATKENVDKLIAVIKSEAPQKEKVDACRQLSVIGTKDAIAPLAALLGNEKLSDMARYALEPIPDPAVDDVLRDALGRLKGRPLAGVITSIGVRRDAKAVAAVSKLLQDQDSIVAQAAARALGSIGNQAAAKSLRGALKNVSAANQLAVCEGLLRCAESLAAKGQRDQAIEIYDLLLSTKAAHQVRAGALRGAILVRGNEGLSLLRQHLKSDDYILFSAAVQASYELPKDKAVTDVLTDGLSKLPADNQILVILAIGKRGDAAALPTLFALAKSGEKTVRIAAIKALPAIGHSSAVPVLVELLADADRQISEVAQESLAALPGKEAEAAVMAMFNSNKTDQRLTALELIGRRRMTTSVPALLKAAGDADPKVRSAAIKKVGELGGPAELPALLKLFMDLKESQDISAAEQALLDVCAKADNPQSYNEKFIGLLSQAQPAQKSSLLRVLSAIGGANALKVVRDSVNDSDAQVHTAAIRALSGWKTIDAAPELLALAKTASNPNDKTLCLRGYIGLAARPEIPADQRLSMCREAAGLIERNEEKKLLLGVLGTVPAVEALSMTMVHIDNSATKDEASMAAVAISEKIVEQKPTEVADALQKVMQATDNKDVIRRAREILNKAKKTAGK